MEALRKLRKLLEPLKNELLGEGFQSDKDDAPAKNREEKHR